MYKKGNSRYIIIDNVVGKKRSLLHLHTLKAGLMNKISRSFISRKVKDVPTLPVVVQKIISLVNDPDSDRQEISKAASSDIIIASKVLRLANSSYYGFSGKIATVDEAIKLLGSNAILSIALSISAISSFSEKEGNPFDFYGFWQHSLAVGSTAKLIASKSKTDNELAFIAGLLHDIGKIILYFCVPEEYSELVEEAKTSGKPLMSLERKYFETTSIELGTWLSKKWNLPPLIVEGIECQRKPKTEEGAHLISAITNISNIMVLEGRIGWSGDEKNIQQLSKDVLKVLNIDKEKLKDIRKEMCEKYKEVESFLSALS